MAEVFALKAIDHDNVATVFTNDVKAGMIANVADKKGHHFEIQLLSDVRIHTGRIGNCPEQIADKTNHRYNSRHGDHHNLSIQGKLLISKHSLPLSCRPVFFRRAALGLLENIAKIMRVFVAHFIADLRCFHR